ncbi:hypothetical protein D3C71_1745680 [compost metagenome]
MRSIRQADAQAISRKRKIAGVCDPHAIYVHIDGGGCFDGVLHTFHADPTAAVPGQRPTHDAEVEDLLNAGGAKHRDHGVYHGKLALVACGRRLARVIVPHQHQDPSQS